MWKYFYRAHTQPLLKCVKTGDFLEMKREEKKSLVWPFSIVKIWQNDGALFRWTPIVSVRGGEATKPVRAAYDENCVQRPRIFAKQSLEDAFGRLHRLHCCTTWSPVAVIIQLGWWISGINGNFYSTEKAQ